MPSVPRHHGGGPPRCHNLGAPCPGRVGERHNAAPEGPFGAPPHLSCPHGARCPRDAKGAHRRTRRRQPGVRSPSQSRRTPLSPSELSPSSSRARPGCSASSAASSAQQLSHSRHHCSLRESTENGGSAHLSRLLTCPSNPRDNTHPQVNGARPPPGHLPVSPGSSGAAPTHPLTGCTAVRVPPPTPQVPAPVWAPRASLTGAPAGHCPGAAAPGRAGGWGRAAPPAAAARRGHRDVLRLPRLPSCRGTEPRGTHSPQRCRELPAPTPEHNPSHPEQRLQRTGGLLGGDLCGFGGVKDLEHCCWSPPGRCKVSHRVQLAFQHRVSPFAREARVIPGHRWAWPGRAKKLHHHQSHSGQWMEEPMCSLFSPRISKSSAEELNTQGKAKLVFGREELKQL